MLRTLYITKPKLRALRAPFTATTHMDCPDPMSGIKYSLAEIEQWVKRRAKNGKQKPIVKAQDRAVQQTFVTLHYNAKTWQIFFNSSLFNQSL